MVSMLTTTPCGLTTPSESTRLVCTLINAQCSRHSVWLDCTPGIIHDMVTPAYGLSDEPPGGLPP